MVSASTEMPILAIEKIMVSSSDMMAPHAPCLVDIIWRRPVIPTLLPLLMMRVMDSGPRVSARERQHQSDNGD